MGKIITVPFAALLRGLYSITGSYGMSILLFAVVVKLVLLPFQMKSKRSMIRMGRLSGKQAELQKQYANNQKKYNEEVAKLYQEEGVNPAGCLWSILPMFVLIPLYSIIYRPITHFMGLSEEALATVKEAATALGFNVTGTAAAYEQIFLTDFVSAHWDTMQGTVDGLINVNFMFLGIDLSQVPSAAFSSFAFNWTCIGVILVPVIAAVSQLISSIVTMKSNGQSSQQQGQARMMNILMPLMSLWFCFSMPAAMGVYWTINSILMGVQEVLLGKFYTKKITAEEEARSAQRDADRKKRMEAAQKHAAEQSEKAAKKAKKLAQNKANEKKTTTNEAGRVGERPYARGRNYREDRYEDKE